MGKVVKGLAWFAREIISVWLWTLITIKIFAYDIEDEIIRYFPWSGPVFRFRFFIIIAVLAVALLLLNRKSLRHTVLFIAFYPLVLLGWRVPKLLWRNWAIALIFLPTIVAFISTIKRRFIFATIAILSAFTIVVASQQYLIGAAMALLLAFLIGHYVDRFRFAYGGSEILQDVADKFASGQQKNLDAFRNKEMREAESVDP